MDNPLLAKEWYQKAAAQGIVDAIASLQRLARSGALGIHDMQVASEKLEQAVSKQNPQALFLQGVNYANGEGGVLKDLSMAERYFRKSADMGFNAAQFASAQVLLDLDRPAEAFAFALKGANGGCHEAQWLVGELYAFGHGCKQDSKEAHRWLRRAQQQRSLEDHVDIEKFIEDGRSLCEFEVERPLEAKGSLLERRNRYRNSFLRADPEAREMMDFHDKLVNQPAPTPFGGSAMVRSPHWVPEMLFRANQGSVIARGFFLSMGMCQDLLQNGNLVHGLKLYRKAYRTWDVFARDEMERSLLDSCIKTVLKRHPSQPDALFFVWLGLYWK
jgi:hypothetical protein